MNLSMNLTSRQSEILSFIRDCAEERGGIPSVREIMARFGFSSPATVASHLDLMEKKGAIRREAGRSRNIILPDRELRKSRPELLEVPLYGMIPAGIPEGQEQEVDRCITVDPETIKIPRNAKTFALEVRGDSMIGAGILDRDVVILEHTEPRNRDIVAALIDGEVTLKRYLVEGGVPFLRAENPLYPDLIPARELLIQGVFRALIRTHLPR
ncbi:MAG: transcriptional repressor LexA [Verrucomicrobia bacterium]|nr:transcriptional repressor LexA [Verrucomicrobiota bacterium]